MYSCSAPQGSLKGGNSSCSWLRPGYSGGAMSPSHLPEWRWLPVTSQGDNPPIRAPSGLRMLPSLGMDPSGPGATVHTLHHRGPQARRAPPIKVSLSFPSAHRKHK